MVDWGYLFQMIDYLFADGAVAPWFARDVGLAAERGLIQFYIAIRSYPSIARTHGAGP